MSSAFANQSRTSKTGDSKMYSTAERSSMNPHVTNLKPDTPDYISHLKQTIVNQVVQGLSKNDAKGFDFTEITIQPKLKISEPGDEYEQEADRVAEEIMTKDTNAIVTTAMSASDDGIYRKCQACEMKRKEEENEKQLKISRKPSPNVSNLEASNEIANEINYVRSISGASLDSSTQEFMKLRFGFDFGDVKIHTDDRAARSANAMNASAYTIGNDIVFGEGQYRPSTSEGRWLLAHELTHTVQQSTASSMNLMVIQRQQLGTRVTHSPGSTSRFRRITGEFDGRDFAVFGDGVQLIKVPAQSGRPYSVTPTDASRCGGSISESYMNNPRYVGISDNGPIPEGDFQFRATEMTTFSAAEQAQMLLGGNYSDPFGRSLHGGDWGAGRVALNKIRVMPAMRGCGNTGTRSGFFLHGGIMPGSSGCIDIGNSAFDNLVKLLIGYRGPIIVTVRYRHPAPEVGEVERGLGRFMYPREGNPTVTDRLRSLFSP